MQTSKEIHLTTWKRTLTKSTPTKDERWEKMVEEIITLLSQYPQEKIYIVSALEREKDLQKRIEDCLIQQQRGELFQQCLFKHYGETRGTNGLREATTLVFTTTQFKGDGYYRSLALEAGVADVTAPFKGSNTLRFHNQDLEEIRLRDTVSVIIQEIGRTKIRDHGQPQSIRVILPWNDRQGIAFLKQQLEDQFQARVCHDEREEEDATLTRLEQVVTLLEPGQEMSRNDIAQHLGITLKQFRKWLAPEIREELWGLEVTVDSQKLSRTPESKVEEKLQEVRQIIQQTDASESFQDAA